MKIGVIGAMQMEVDNLQANMTDTKVVEYSGITFVEGKNMRYIASVIAENTNNTEEQVMPVVERRVIKLDSSIPEDEDFGL